MILAKTGEGYDDDIRWEDGKLDIRDHEANMSPNRVWCGATSYVPLTLGDRMILQGEYCAVVEAEWSNDNPKLYKETNNSSNANDKNYYNYLKTPLRFLR